ncbi:helix-turn-helix domain-containing protein [Nocardia sp. NPDC046763]|uniref:helix-turn-helix domain-containing protein n=1 Tax=Nocardia sp. NPDC046763 TaxID=3155256 RepID=UPI0033FC9796
MRLSERPAVQIAAPSVPDPDPDHRSIPHAHLSPVRPAGQRRRSEKPSWGYDRPEVGVYLRRRREALGLTQEEVAVAALTTLSSLRKWEAGLRKPSTESLTVWCRALDLPDWTLRKITSLVLNGMDALQVNTLPLIISDDDLDHLEMIASPAYYLSFPHMDVLAANTAARKLAPDLVPADPDSPRPTNVVEWIMTKTARDHIVNWQAVATRTIHMLRVMGPGLVPQQRLDEIFNSCHAQAPKIFTRLFTTELTKAEAEDDSVLVRNPATGTVDLYTCRSLRPMQPLRPYEQLQIVKRNRPAR